MGKGKKLLILLVVFVVIAVLAIVFLPKLKASSAPVSVTDNEVKVFDFTQEDVDHVTWWYDGEVNTFNRTDAGYFYAGGDDPGYDGTQVKYMVSALVFLGATKVLDEHDALSVYGLDESVHPTIEVTLKDGSVRCLWLGNPTVSDDNYIYGSIGDGKVYILTSFTQDKFQYTLQDLLPEEEESTEASA